MPIFLCAQPHPSTSYQLMLSQNVCIIVGPVYFRMQIIESQIKIIQQQQGQKQHKQLKHLSGSSTKSLRFINLERLNIMRPGADLI